MAVFKHGDWDWGLIIPHLTTDMLKILRRSSGLDSTLILSKQRKTSMGLGPSSVCILSILRIPDGEERIDLLRESQLL